MAKTIEQLEAEKRAIDARIKVMKNAQRESARVKILRAIDAAGMLDLPEAELTARLGKLKGGAQ